MNLSRWPLRERVLVNLEDGRAFDAVLWQVRGAFLVLRVAQLIEAGIAAVPMDGEVIVERPKVAFIQVRR